MKASGDAMNAASMTNPSGVTVAQLQTHVAHQADSSKL